MSRLGLVGWLLAQADGAGTAADATMSAAPEASSAFGWIALLVLAGVIIVPFALGQFLERLLRLKDVGFRIGVVLFTLTIGLGPFVTNYVRTGSFTQGVLKFGIDLAGGTNLVYLADVEQARRLGKRVDSETMDRMVAAVRNRVAPTGTEEVTVRKVGDDRIEVIVPGADQEKTERVKRQIVNLGSLEFSIVVNSRRHPELYAKGQEQLSRPEEKEIRIGNVVRARWVPVAFDRETKQPKITSLDRGELIRPATVEGRPGYEILVLHEPDPKKRITGDYLVNAREEFDQSGPVVGFTFNLQGGNLFQNLTFEYQPEPGDPFGTKLAIVLSGAVHSAPRIEDPIGTHGVIRGNFTQHEIQELVNVLNAGALEIPLIETPASEATVSPLLGLDVREKGLTAMWVAAVSVFVVTLAYYWLPGLIADFCLVLNVLLLTGIMSLIDATFTLPGLAGFVLSIGMAVDANVLIFERMREEQAKGASLRMSIHNGFSKALSTIVDSNLTTLITAVVLYVIGTDAVKGFAVTLFIGIVVSMYTAVYVGRLIFDILERKRWLKSLKMGTAIGATHIDFLGKTTAMAGLSLLLIALGLGGVFYRGADNFDIDFSGGVMVAFEFEGRQPPIDEVRTLLAERLGKNISVEELSVGASEGGGGERLIRLRTTDERVDYVSQQINEVFAATPYKLVRQTVELGPVTAIAAGDQAAEASESNGEAAGGGNGGHQATLKISQPLFAVSLKEALASAVQSVNEQRYGSAAELLTVTATDVASNEKGREFLVQAKAELAAADLQAALETLKARLEDEPFFAEKNTFATSVGKEMRVTAILAIVISMGAIVLYLWFRFHGVTFGLAACIALLHDVCITLGMVALGSFLANTPLGTVLMLTDFKINLPMIAAFLTIVGYSLNDTIVVFDRIREVRGKNPRLTTQMVNQSVNQTLSRTLLTSVTTLVVVVVLYVMGGEGLHGFSYCLFVGIVVGTYSSIYVASPVLLWLMNRQQTRAAAT